MEMDDSHLNWVSVCLCLFLSCCYGLDEIWQSFIELCVLNVVNSVSGDCQISSSGLSKVVVSMAHIHHFG
jgi:hypothetical protein